MKSLTTRALVIAAVAVPLATSNAMAGGTLSFNFAPQNAKQEQVMRAGLMVYGLVNEIQGSGIRQRGTGNSAGLRQFGSGNVGIVHQDGAGHNGTVTQSGNNNAYGLFQFGRNADAQIAQSGNGATGTTFQFGW